VTDFELHFDQSGSGTPLLLIHGFPFDNRSWEGQLKALSRRAHVLAPDLPGFGDSPAGKPPYTMERYAEDCVAVLDGLDITEPVVVGGLSMGGYIALAFVRHFPERVAGLLLASTRPGADSEEGKANRDKAIADVKAKGVATLVEGMHPKLLAPSTYETKPEVAARLKDIMLNASEAGVVGALQAMRDRPDATEDLAQIEVPALVIHGEEDGVIPISEAEDMAAALPYAELVRVAGAGHLPNMEQPQVFNEAVEAFLGRI
jgi:pimeloyl-ACP methyl ester carboxylesterase